MAIVTGTSGDDTLIGTVENDILLPNGGIDLLSGLDGADEYRLYQTSGTNYLTIDDQGTDGAIDTITGGRGLYASASLGYSAWATAERIGNDLVITLPGKPYRFHSPGYGSATIEISGQYGGNTVEYLVADGVDYFLNTTSLGTAENDIMAGTSGDDDFFGSSGNDFLDGNRGADTLQGGAGSDTLFGDGGKDVIYGNAGNDRIYSGTGGDRVKAGGGHDIVFLDKGNDKAWGGSGNDSLYGQLGNDRLIGGSGQDMLDGGYGNDRLLGGLDGDTYRLGYDVDALAPAEGWGNDIIKDIGDANPVYNNVDKIELFGFYGPSSGLSDEAFARLDFDRQGRNMVITADDGLSTLTVKNQFHENTAKYAIEELEFNAGYWEPLHFKILDGQRDAIGDDRRYDNGIGGEYNEVIFGTDGADGVFGNSGTNFIWLGGGADTLIYKETDPANLFGFGGGAAHDIVMDFNSAEDHFDFTEIKGMTFGDLTISEAADGDATISWDSGRIDVANIAIELRGVSVSEVTEDLFVF